MQLVGCNCSSRIRYRWPTLAQAGTAGTALREKSIFLCLVPHSVSGGRPAVCSGVDPGRLPRPCGDLLPTLKSRVPVRPVAWKSPRRCSRLETTVSGLHRYTEPTSGRLSSFDLHSYKLDVSRNMYIRALSRRSRRSLKLHEAASVFCVVRDACRSPPESGSIASPQTQWALCGAQAGIRRLYDAECRFGNSSLTQASAVRAVPPQGRTLYLRRHKVSAGPSLLLCLGSTAVPCLSRSA